MLNIIKTLVKKLGLSGFLIDIIKLYAKFFPNQIVTRSGIKYSVDLRQVVDFGTFLGGWEKNTLDFLRKTLKQGDVVVEVGANVGAHTLYIAKLIGPMGHVYAFEPTSFALNKLQKNISLNPDLANITVRSDLVTDNDKSVPNMSINSSWTLSGERSPSIIRDFSVISIDSFVRENNINRLDLVKIDVDGYDFKVLRGASDAISNLRPIIFCELCEYTLRAQGDSIKDIFTMIESLGYSAYYENGERIGNVDDVLSMVGLHTSINGIFVHSCSVRPG
jgi:FkbM family methyltransferase